MWRRRGSRADGRYAKVQGEPARGSTGSLILTLVRNHFLWLNNFRRLARTVANQVYIIVLRGKIERKYHIWRCTHTQIHAHTHTRNGFSIPSSVFRVVIRFVPRDSTQPLHDIVSDFFSSRTANPAKQRRAPLREKLRDRQQTASRQSYRSVAVFFSISTRVCLPLSR